MSEGPLRDGGPPKGQSRQLPCSDLPGDLTEELVGQAPLGLEVPTAALRNNDTEPVGWCFSKNSPISPEHPKRKVRVEAILGLRIPLPRQTRLVHLIPLGVAGEDDLIVTARVLPENRQVAG